MRTMLLTVLLAGCVACAISGLPGKRPDTQRPSSDGRYVCIGFTASWCDETLSATLPSVEVPQCGMVQMITSPPKQPPETHRKQPLCESPSRKYRDLPSLNEHPV